MIPPSRLQGTIRPRSLSTPSLPSHLQTRSFFGWKRCTQPTWESKTDPSYNRCRRYRSLQTRAKLFNNLRRRSQYYWDTDAKPFFTPKPEHIRYASHWQLGGRPPRWTKEQAEKQEAERQDKETEDHQLTRREIAWKEQMEAMRRKIDADPYEAVFGKRFEPFWSPLVPTWMRDEIGLAKEGEKGKRQAENNTPKQQRPVDVKKPEVQPRAPERKDSGVYAYSSETSWDSKSNQVKKSQWDSDSGKTSHYTYDPISGRMMPTKDRNVPAAKVVEQPEPKQPMVAGKQRVVDQELDTLNAQDIRASVGKNKKPDLQSQGQNAASREIEQQLKDFKTSSERLREHIAGIVDQATTVPFADRLQSSVQRHVEGSQQAKPPQPLQPSLQRMQSKLQPVPSEYDDSAVHEATEPSPSTPNLPKSWDDQAELLQAERVKRTTSSRPSPTQRWLEDMNARKAAYDANKAAKQAAQDTATASERAKLQKANALLQSEVETQKTAMRQHEERYAHKIRSLRSELDTAYKQSSVHADEFKDQISKLEKRLASAQRAVDGSGLQSTEQRYREKVRNLKGELDVAYKQSSVHADEFTQRIKSLEAELSRINKATGGEDQTVRKPELKAMQGEGDFCTNVTKYADSGKWYKRPSTMPQLTNEQVAKAEQKMRDQELVRNVRQIYEKAYGAIDSAHRQGAARQEDTDAGAYENAESTGQYTFKPDGLGSELQGKSCGDALQGNAAKKQAKVAQKDVSPAEEPFVQNEEPGQYNFKDDGLARELKGKGCGDALQGNAVKKQAKVAQKDVSENERPFVLNEESGQYTFKEDGLGSELKGKSCGDVLQGNAAKKVLKGVVTSPLAGVVEGSDAYEAAAGGKPAAQTKAPEPAEVNELEAELKGLGKEQPAYASDEYEAAAPRIKASTTLDKTKVNHDLEAELKNKGKERPEYASDAYENAAAAAEPSKHVAVATPAVSTASTPLWQHPPLYRIVMEGDSWFKDGDLADITTTSHTASPDESPAGLTVTQILAKLNDPKRYLQKIAKVQQEGWQVVDVTAQDIIVFRKVDVEGMKRLDAEKAENAGGKPTGEATKAGSSRNPVDGMSKRDVVTGNFASPTGFVNFDDAFDGPGKQTGEQASTPKAVSSEDTSLRIKRAEPVYSGERLAPTSRGSKISRKAQRRFEAQRQREQRGQRSRVPEFFLGSLTAVAIAGTAAYVVGSDQSQRKRREEAQKWVDMGMGRGKKWVLDDGEWNGGKQR